MPVPLSTTSTTTSSADVEGHRHAGCPRVPHGVADPLPDDGLDVGGQVTGDQAVHRSRHPHRGPEIGAGGLGDDVQQAPPEAAAVPGTVRGVQVEDRRPDVAHRLVELLDRRPHPARCPGVADLRQDALQAEPGGEDPLDHVVVQVAGDPVAVLEDVEPAGDLLSGRKIECERCLVGERADQGGERAVEGSGTRPSQGDDHR